MCKTSLRPHTDIPVYHCVKRLSDLLGVIWNIPEVLLSGWRICIPGDVFLVQVSILSSWFLGWQAVSVAEQKGGD